MIIGEREENRVRMREGLEEEMKRERMLIRSNIKISKFKRYPKL